jgi:hypothetical protein
MNNNIQDWQLGNKSKLSSTERMNLHQEWLKRQHQDIKDKIQSRNKVEEKPVQGFPKDEIKD